ncbi:MAG: acyl-CoA dehydrogenase family protein [Microthrixaceae bacterium]
MRFALTGDQVDFRDAVRGLLADTCPPAAVRTAWGGRVGEETGGGGGDGRVRAAWSALAEMGVLGMLVPESAGGLDMDDEDIVPMLVECGRAALPDPVTATAYVAATTLRDLGGAVADEWLPRIAAGEVAVAAGPLGDAPLAGALTADAFLVGDAGVLRWIRADEVELEPVESVDASRGLARLRDAAAAGTVLVEGPDAAVLSGAAADRAALGAAAELVGLSERMLEMTVAYASERRQFGVPIGSFQAVKHQLADASLAVAFAVPLVLRAANSLAHGDPDAALHVSMAKAKASAAARGAADASLQCHGAIGYTVEYDLHLFMKRAWALAAQAGGPDQHRVRVRAALGLRV